VGVALESGDMQRCEACIVLLPKCFGMIGEERLNGGFVVRADQFMNRAIGAVSRVQATSGRRDDEQTENQAEGQIQR